MEPIEGYADLQSEDPDGEGPKEAPEPMAKEMSGLNKVDDLTFEITLSAPNSAFESAIGYSAFNPLPQSFFDAGDDKTAWGKSPVGNGPFKFVSWTDNQEIKLTRNDDYAGEKAKVKDVTIKIYQDADAAYADLTSDNLDFLQQVPTSVLAGDTWKNDLGERAIDKPVLVVQTFVTPIYAGEAVRQRRLPARAVDGDRSGQDHQADLRGHPDPVQGLLARRRSTATRRPAASSARSTRPRPRNCWRRPASPARSP